MTTAYNNKAWALPKFGEWDAKNPASADGFTVIFQKVRDDKKTTGRHEVDIPPPLSNGAGSGGGGGGDGRGSYRSEFKSGNKYQYTTVPSAKRQQHHRRGTHKKWFLCGGY